MKRLALISLFALFAALLVTACRGGSSGSDPVDCGVTSQNDADHDGYPDVEGCPNCDCNDYDAAINPGVDEIPGDGIDNDCDGYTDETD